MSVMFTGAANADQSIPKTARFVEETNPPPPVPDAGIEETGAVTPYDVALSRVLAAKLGTEWRVTHFIDTHLAEEPLAWADVDAWMRAHGPIPGEPATWYATLPVNPSLLWEAQAARDAGKPETVTLEASFTELMTREPRPLTLSYVVPGDAIVRAQYIQKDTVLDVLRGVVNWLMGMVPWTEAQASVFVLTGLTPLIPPWRVRVKSYGALATLPRLTLEVDVRTTQKELSAAYQAARALFASDIRSRDLSPKHLELAVFGTLPEGQEGRPAERMQRWNSRHPEWSYRRTDHFTRDVTRARRRLLRDQLPHPEDMDQSKESSASGGDEE